LIDDTEDKAYFIAIEFEEVDFNLLQTHCSFIELRIAREPAFNIISALSNFEKTPKYSDIKTLKDTPKTVSVDKEKSIKLQYYQTKDEVENMRSNILGKITIDVKLDQVQLDVVAEYNFLASNIQLEITGDENFNDVGVLEITNEHFDDNSFYTARNAIRVIGTGDVFERGQYTLIIKTDTYSKKLLQRLSDNGVPASDDILFPITIKIDSTPVGDDLKTTDGELRLIDIEYNGDPDNDGKAVNTQQELSIVMEFNDDLDNSDLKFEDNAIFAMLLLDPRFHKGATKGEKMVKPSQIDRASVLSENMIQLIFDANTLKKGATYTLKLDRKIGITQDIVDQDVMKIQTLLSTCNPKGTYKLKTTDSCKCKYPYKGPTCFQCQDEYNFNPDTNECVLSETCQEDTCNGHGQCFVNKKTGSAECVCEPGFKDDVEGAR
jgi:hypothetical protein